MKKVIVLLLVLSVVCSSAFAFSGMGKLLSKSSQDSSAEVVEEVKEEPAIVLDSPVVQESSSSVAPAKTSNPVSTALESLNEKSRLTKKDLEEHKANLEAVATDVEMMIADLEAIHPFANAGLQLGFNAGRPVFGAVIGGGAKFGNGIVLTGIVGYDMLTIDEGFKWDFKLSLDKLSATLMVGYEF